MTLPRQLGLGLAGLIGVLLVLWSAGAESGWVSLEAAMLLAAAFSIVFLVAQAGPSLTMCGALALMCFSGYWANLGSPLPLDRLVIAVAFAGALARPDMRRKILRRLEQPLGLLLVLIIAYTVFSALRAGTLTEKNSFYALLDSLGIVPYALYIVAPVVFEAPEDRENLLWTLVLIGAYLGFTALFETIHLNALVFPKYILNPNVGIHFGRARGPFVEADANGLVMFACGVAATIALIRWRGERKAILAALVLFLCGTGIIFTLTRAIWIASVVATLITLLLFKQLRRYFVPATLAIVVVAVGALVAIPGLASQAQERSDALRPVWDRLNTDAAAVRMFEQRPLTGFGWYTFEHTGPEYMRQAGGYPLTGAGLNVHNVFLSRLAELGLIGTLAAVIALLWAIIGSAIRAGPPEMHPWRMGLVAVAIQWIIVANFVPLTYALPTALLWLWAGILCPVPELSPAGDELPAEEDQPSPARLPTRATSRTAPTPQDT
ncbi:MAG TPA: O-antigen ligase family protein [Solirubrobacterales bacterium]|nr:O-antigen ligase family protein [Solirubrobacterales bacterium]